MGLVEFENEWEPIPYDLADAFAHWDIRAKSIHLNTAVALCASGARPLDTSNGRIQKASPFEFPSQNGCIRLCGSAHHVARPASRRGGFRHVFYSDGDEGGLSESLERNKILESDAKKVLALLSQHNKFFTVLKGCAVCAIGKWGV